MQAAIVGGNVTQMKARAAFLAYRELVREGRATEDDQVLMRSYRAIARGHRVLDLRETLRQAGLDEQLRPRLAIARADQARVQFGYFHRLERWAYGPNEHDRWRRPPVGNGITLTVTRGVYAQLDGATYVTRTPEGRRGYTDLHAPVPPIPAQFRPADGLAGLHILWEVEWDPVPPTDPILLKRIGGNIFAVLAQWDLTDLERAVLGARLS